MLFYEGTKHTGFIQPRALAKYDIVITTYAVLQSETNYLDLPHSNSAEGRRFRNPKRFMAAPAALPCIQWWRVCLDEAQMIENTMTRTAEMALRLSAVNRCEEIHHVQVDYCPQRIFFFEGAFIRLF